MVAVADQHLLVFVCVGLAEHQRDIGVVIVGDAQGGIALLRRDGKAVCAVKYRPGKRLVRKVEEGLRRVFAHRRLCIHNRGGRTVRKRGLFAACKSHVKPRVRVIEVGGVHGVARDGRIPLVGVVKDIVDLQTAAVLKTD